MHEYNTIERCKIPALECARIIDGLLSSGEIIETQGIYDELENTYHWVQELHIKVFNNYKASLKSDNAKDKDQKRKDYEYMCTCAYSYSVSKDALPRLRREIRRIGLNPDLILRRVNGVYYKNKKGYQYTIKGFSAFNTDVDYKRENLKKQRTTNTIALFKENAAKLLKGQQEQNTVGVFPSDIDSTVKSLIDIIYQLKDDTYNTAFNAYIERLSMLKKERPDNWITSFLELIVQVKNEFRSLSSNLAYADLLIEYADFIINYSVPKELLPDDINNDLVDFAQGLYMGAISRSIENNNKVKQISYLLKYGDFLIKTSLYDLLRDISRKVLRLCESIRETTNIEKEYASANYLYATYLQTGNGDMEAEPYFEEAFRIRARLAGYNVDTLERVSEDRPSIEDLFLLCRSMDQLAYIYLRLYPNSSTKGHLRLFQKSYKIMKECAKREPMSYRIHLATTLYNIGTSYLNTHKYDVAMKYLEKALNIDKALVIESPEIHLYTRNYSYDLERISVLYLWTIKDYIKAEEAALEASLVIENLYTYNPRVYEYDYVDKLYWLAVVYQEIGKYDEALEKSFSSLRILENANACAIKTEKRIMDIKKLVAEIYAKKFIYNKANEFASDAFIIAKNLYIRSNTKQHFEQFKYATKTRVSILQRMSDNEMAESVISDCIALLNSHSDSLGESQIMDILELKQELASIYRNYKKEYDKALVIYAELRSHYIKHLKSTISYADFLYEYAFCYSEAGQHKEYEALLNDAILEYCSIKDQTLLVKEKTATTHLLLALAISIDENYEEAFKSYDQSISLYNKIYRSEPLSVVGYLAMAHRCYGLTLKGIDDVNSLEHYIAAIDYYIEEHENINEINEVIPELSEVILGLSKDVSLNLINSTKILINKCKQLENIDVESLEHLEANLQILQKQINSSNLI